VHRFAGVPEIFRHLAAWYPQKKRNMFGPR